MATINVSKNRSNYSQRNNEVNPYKSCNTTSMVMALSYIPKLWKFFKDSPTYKQYSEKFKQPEDCLQQYMLDNGLKPTNHFDLSSATNKFVGRQVTKFTMSLSISGLLDELKANRPVVISGNFPKSDGKTLGHIVCLVGAVIDNQGNVSKWIIDDPYGNTLKDWQGSGNDIALPNDYFIKNIKNCGCNLKWAHTFLL
jgi:hypothetical protein